MCFPTIAYPLMALQVLQTLNLCTTRGFHSSAVLTALRCTITLYAGMQDEGNPMNLLATMAGWAQQAQTALFTMGEPVNADGSPVSKEGALPAAHPDAVLTVLPLSALELLAVLSCWASQTLLPMFVVKLTCHAWALHASAAFSAILKKVAVMWRCCS